MTDGSNSGKLVVCEGVPLAIYHLHARFVQRSKGRSSVAAAAYRAGEKLRDDRRGESFDFRHKSGQVVHSEILLPDHVPERMADRQTLWGTVEAGIKRKDGQPAFEVEVALPRELTASQRVELAQGFAAREFVENGLIVDLCIHNGRASDGGEHPHAHMLITTRRWDDNGAMGKAARDLQDSPAVLKRVYALEQEGKVDEALLAAKGTHLAGWRERWADDCNDALEAHEHEARVDHRTLVAQRIARSPIPYIGVAFHDRLDSLKGWLADRVEAFKEADRFRELREQFDRIRDRRRDLTAEFVEHAQEHARELVADRMEEQERDLSYER